MSKPIESVVIVDDEADIRQIVTLALEAVAGFTVTACSNGEDALTTIPVQQPDIVLLDVMMPGMDGPTVLQHLLENPQAKDIPVIFMTAKAQQHEIEGFMALGAKGVVPKPFDPMTLADEIRKILDSVD